MKKFLLVVFCASFFLSTRSQVIINNLADPYTQDFNTLANAGLLNNTLPTGWAFLETDDNANLTYAADNGSIASGNTYSYGVANNAERAFGTLLSGTLVSTIGVQFTNNSGSTITSVTVTYTGEQWRLGTINREDRLDFQYSTDAMALDNGTYNHVDALDFIAPAKAVAGPKDGNDAANKAVIPAFEIAGLNIPAGASFWFRWTDFNASGADDGLSIDDFTVTFNGNANPPCDEPATQPTNLILNPTPTTVAGSFTASVPPANEYLVVRSLVALLGDSPTDGVNYAPGQALGNGTVVSVSPSTDFNAAGLDPNTEYFFFVFALNNENCGGGPNYNITNPLELSTTTLPLAVCVNPPNPPTDLNLVAGNTSVSGTFTAAANANRYLVVRSTNNILGFTPTDGVTYVAGQVIGADVIVSYNSNTNFNAGGLVANTQYFFFVFAANGECTGEPFYSALSLDGNTTTTEGGVIPAGYYQSADGLACSELKTALFNIIKPLVANPNPDYGGICFIYQSTDYRKSDDGINDIIWDMYSDNPGINNPDPYEFEYGIDVDGCGGAPNNPPIPGTLEGLMYNREHSFPRSWFGGAIEPMNSDIMHIFPTDKEVNAKRNSFPFGETNVPSWTSLNGSKLGNSTFPGYNGVVFEPINEYKGDFARVQLYMATCYENQIISNNWSGNSSISDDVLLSAANEPDAAKRQLQIYEDWYIKLLYKWHIEDPVSTKEIDRNNAVYTIQGNRNPFVDHPEYVIGVWNCSGVLPVTITDFSVMRNTNGALLKWSATQETNFKLYEVEQSTDGIVFSKIGEVKGNNLSNYSFTIHNLPKAKTVFYRLKMIDIDSKFSYSKTVALKLNTVSSTATVYPNPTSENLMIKLEDALSSNSEIKVSDLTGRVVLQQKVNAGQKNINLSVHNLPSGRYFIKMYNSKETINQSFTIIK